MTIPTVVTDLSATAASNAPAGSDAPSVLDDIQRAHGQFIRELYDAGSTAVGATGTGVFVKATSPTLVTPALGTPASGNLTSCTIDGTVPPGGKYLPMVSKSADYTFVLTDLGSQFQHASADTTARTFTIPANASVAYPNGAALPISNLHGAGVVTLSITSDTMYLAGSGSTGSISIAPNGFALPIKQTATEWLVLGVGLS